MFFDCCFRGGKEDVQNDDAETVEVAPPPRRQEKSKRGEFVIDDDNCVTGVHNSAGKYAPDARVCLNDVPFDERLERAMQAEEEARVKRTLDL